ncbi:LysM peptidoglycan-binding domain-containing protein [Bacteroidota bacterium]
MRKAIKYIFLVLIFLSVKVPASSLQDMVNINKSEEKILIKGEKYFIHNIEKGQTLYSIAKAYGVSQKDIALKNPGVFSELKTGQSLLIPFEKPNISFSKEKPDTTNFFYHKVLSDKETIFSLTKKYDIKPREFKEANPDVLWGLRVNNTYKIPKTGVDIANINIENIEEEAEPINEEPEIDLSYFEEIINRHEKRKYKIALLLPFNTIENDTIDVYDSIQEKIIENILPESEQFLEFYHGVILALDTLQKSGLSVDIIVKDTEANSNRVEEIFDELRYENIDLIIGPVFESCLRVARRYCRNQGIKLVSPLSTKSEILENYPNIFQVNPSESIQHNFASSYLSRFYDKNIVFIMRTEDSLYYIDNDYLYYDSINFDRIDKFYFDSLKMEEYYSNILNKITDNNSPEDLHYKKVYFDKNEYSREKDDTLSANVEDYLSMGMENLVIILSKDEGFATHIITKLNTALTRNYNTQVFGMYNWLQDEKIELDHLFDLNFQYFSSFGYPYIDYSSKIYKNFFDDYWEKYHHEPSRFSIQGYDVTLYFLSALNWFGPDFEKYIPYIDYIISGSAIQTKFDFKQTSRRNGFENHAVSIIEYNPEELKKKIIKHSSGKFDNWRNNFLNNNNYERN